MGDYDQAIAFFMKALKIRIATPSEDESHPYMHGANFEIKNHTLQLQIASAIVQRSKPKASSVIPGAYTPGERLRSLSAPVVAASLTTASKPAAIIPTAASLAGLDTPCTSTTSTSHF